MTKSARLLAGSTLAGPDVATLPEVEGMAFGEWVLARARSRDGISRLEIQAAAGQGPRAWRRYVSTLVEAHGLALAVGGGQANNYEGQRYRAHFYAVTPEACSNLPEVPDAVAID